MSRAPFLLFLLLASCNRSPDWDSAEKRYLFMIENHAPKADLCAEARRNAQAALAVLDRGEYNFWLQMEKEDCGQPPAS